jgi:iron complex transport system substrate-binding protein
VLSCTTSSKPPVGKIVCLVPSVTEIIYALGQEKQLAANTTFCDYPAAAKSVYKVGDFSNPSIEKIVALKPRLVFATLPEQRTAVEKLQQMGIKVFISRPNSLDSLFREIVAIGQALGAQARAEALADSLRGRLARITVPARKRRVYFEVSDAPLMAVGKSSFIAEVIERAGGINIFGDIAKEYPVVTQEEVIRRDPEVVITLRVPQMANSVNQRIGWNNVTAVREHRVYDIDPDIVIRSGPRLIQGIAELAARIQAP